MGDCLPDETLGRILDGSLSGGERDAATCHMADCPDCRLRWVALAADGAEAAQAPAVARTVFPAWRRLGLAAAALVCAVAAWHVLRPSAPTAGRHLLPPGEKIAGRSESFDIGEASPARVFSLPDGSRLRIHPGSAARFVPAGPDGRFTVELVRGTLDAEIEKGEGAVRVASAAGVIRVLGTAFRARAFTCNGAKPGDPPAARALTVEVEHGLVELSEGGKTVAVPAGRRGLLWTEGDGPARAILQEARPIDWRSALSQWDGIAPSGAVFLLGSTWDGAADFRGLLLRTDLAPPLRASLARLAALLEEPHGE